MSSHNNNKQQEKMESYCLSCQKEQEMVINTINIDNNTKEKTILGKCKVCGEKLCRILSINTD